jgi:hypothetical protein
MNEKINWKWVFQNFSLHEYDLLFKQSVNFNGRLRTQAMKNVARISHGLQSAFSVVYGGIRLLFTANV